MLIRKGIVIFGGFRGLEKSLKFCLIGDRDILSCSWMQRGSDKKEVRRIFIEMIFLLWTCMIIFFASIFLWRAIFCRIVLGCAKNQITMWIANQAKSDQTNRRSKNQSTTSIGIELDLIFFWDHHKWNWK
jgi:predicted MFS family arabinose efflux permease